MGMSNGFFEKVNVIGGAVVALLAGVFGEYWFLFAGLVVFNVVDWVTGWQRAVLKKQSNSAVGAKGILKKVSYWVVIGISFYIGFAFEEMGKKIGVPLGFMTAVGWFVLANYLVNEIRSILENLIDMGVKVPDFLTKGLKITADKLEEVAGKEDEKNENKKKTY